MKNDGTKTASTHNMLSRRGTAVLREASTTARARATPASKCVWMLSMTTVASSTRTPTASARPPRVMMLTVWPVSQSQMTAASSANGMVATTIRALRQSRRNSSTISPVSSAPSSPSRIRPWMALTT